jgi:hypothetical protein
MVVLVLLMITGCAQKKAEKRYPMQGEIMALDASAHTATIAASKIGDWMDSITMEYTVKQDPFQETACRRPDQATVVVGDPGYCATAVKIAHK